MTEFDEVYYEKLMDGLEVSEVVFSALERTNRIDAEFYQRDNLLVEEVLNKRDKIAIKQCFDVSDGNHMSISDSFCDDGIPYYRGQDIYNLFIENSNPLCISKEAYDKPVMNRSYLKKGDVLMSIVGAIIGNSALVTSDRQAPCSCKLAILRPNNKGIFSETMFVFIKTKYGQSQIQKFKRGAAQTGLLLEDFDQLFIPEFSQSFQLKIRKIISDIKALSMMSEKIMHDSANILEEELGVYNCTLQKEKCSIKSFFESFGKSGRMDAEYYQSEYDYYDNLLKQYHNGYGLIGDICTIKDKNYNPEHKTEYSYIELSDVGQQGDINECNKIYGIDLPTRARRKVSAGDVILSSVEGSLSKCALITPDCDGYLCTNGFYVVRCDSINPETLMMLFKSRPVQALLKKGCSGTILSAIGKDELLKIPLPIIDIAVQEKIMCMVAESNLARRQGKELLDKAVRLVETAIEQGEDVALRLYV